MEQRQLAWLITTRSQVRVLPPQPSQILKALRRFFVYRKVNFYLLNYAHTKKFQAVWRSAVLHVVFVEQILATVNVSSVACRPEFGSHSLFKLIN